VFLCMSWSLSSCVLSIVHIVVPSRLCKVVCVCFIGFCVDSQPLHGLMSRSGFMRVGENVRLSDPHTSIVNGFSRVYVFTFF
jgi:hypothetical protein